MAGLSFVAGVLTGFALPDLFASDRTPQSTEAYARDLVSRYGLNAEQERLLRMVLREDERLELEILRSADWSQLPEALRNRRLAQKRRTNQRIRFVLDPEQRALYDRDSRPENR